MSRRELAYHRLLKSSARSFFHKSLGEIKLRGGAESLSEKKADRKSREARLKRSQCKQSAQLSAAWDFPKRDTYSVSSACREFPHVLQ